jgi:hypothetical protein
MLTRRFIAVGCAVLALCVAFGSASAAVAGHAPYRYQGQRVHFAGEANMIAAINSIGIAMAHPLASEGHVRAAEVHLNQALRFADCQHVQGDLNAALQMLNAFRYRGDRGALAAALQRTECALHEAQEHRLTAQTVYRPQLPQFIPQSYPPVAYPPVYPVPYRNNGLTISKGAFSITIPLNR